jgi:hypothetical protein
MNWKFGLYNTERMPSRKMLTRRVEKQPQTAIGGRNVNGIYFIMQIWSSFWKEFYGIHIDSRD